MIGHYSNYYWWPTGVYGAPYTQDGWRFVTGNDVGSGVTWGGGLTTVISDGCPVPPYYGQHTQTTSQSPIWTDPTGTTHTFNATLVTDQDDCTGSYSYHINAGYATDASGYSLTEGSNGLEVISDNNGNQVYPQVIDRYGNYWSSDSSGNLIDDTGRTPVIKTVSGNVTYYDVLAPNGTINNNGLRVRYTVTTAPVQVQTYFHQPLDSGGGYVTEWSGTLYPIQSIQLPDGTSYTFTYDGKILAGDTTAHYGDLQSVTLPTGGVIHYGFEVFEDSYYNQNRWVSGRKVGNDPSTTFNHSVVSWCGQNAINCREKTIVHKPRGDETVYEQKLNKGAWNTNVSIYTGSASGSPLSTTTNTYSFECSGCSSDNITRTASVTTLSNGLQSQQQYVYDSPWLGKPGKLLEWDYYSGSPSQIPTRETDYSYNSLNGLDLSQVTVFNNGTQTGQTTYNYTTSGATTSGITQHGTANAGGPYLQKVTHWLNGGISPVTHYTMDDTGMVTQVLDPNAHASNTNYQCGNSLPYQSTNALGHVTTYGYDCNSGAITSVKDPNDLANGRAGTTYQYEAGAGRLQSVSYPDGGQTTYSYPSSTEVDTAVLSTPSPTINSRGIVDVFGRPSQRVQAGTSTETSYDVNGRVSCVTNPHYSTPSWTDGTTCISSYDGLDRPLTQTLPDGNTRTWSYPGNTVASTDEAGHQWQRTSDAFGRLTTVIEPNGAETDYTYTSSNLTTIVSQKGIIGVENARLNRTFTTDSLGRTVSVNEPERGVTTSSYDNNGNVTSSTDARGVSIFYVYDALNRLTDTWPNDGTPSQHYRFDETSGWMGPQSNTIGRLSRTVTGQDLRYFGSGSAPGCNAQSSATINYNPANGNPTYCNWTDEVYSYDSMGRLTTMGSALPSEAGWTSHSSGMAYDLAGNLTSLRYPDGRVVTQGFDGAGQLQNVTYDSWNGQHVGSTYAAGFTYTPAGAQTEVTYGNGVYIHTPYNSREQMCHLWSSAANGQVLVDSHIYYKINYYCSNSPGNNGNILQVKDWVNQDHTRTFGYDNMNRISSFALGANASPTMNFDDDSFGNLKQPGLNIVIGTSNRFQDAGYTYDAAGNLAHTNLGVSISDYGFDAASRVFRFNPNPGDNPAAYYSYDANGNRVRKDTAGSGYTEYQYVNGQVLAEKHSDGTWSDYIYANGQKIAKADTSDSAFYYVLDQVGSTRMIVNGTGSPVEQDDYYPFGQKLNNDPSAAQNNYLFAGLERDGETGLDHATFRQYSSTIGRWMSPDPYLGSYDFANPQSFNRYSYVSNTPLTAIDPSGLDGTIPGVGGTIGGCVGAAASEGGNAIADIQCAAGLLSHIFNLFSTPQCYACDHPRPNGAIWDEHGGFQASPYSSIASMIGDVSDMSMPGCEFGACGGGPSDFTGNNPLAVGGPIIISPTWVYSLINLFHFPYADASDPNHRLGGTHYCGPGGGGGTTGGLDGLCAAHDACYRRSGVSAIDNLNPFTSGAAMGGCDRLLCASLSQYSPASRQEGVLRGQIQQVFGCGYINK
jgi:RHS repeat-associated protein